MKFPKLEPIGEILRNQPQKVGQVLPLPIVSVIPKPRNYTQEIKEILKESFPIDFDSSKFSNPFEDIAPLIDNRKYTLNDLEAIETYFNSIDLPRSIHLKQAERIVDVKLFIQSHLTRCKSQLHTISGLPFYKRLIELKQINKLL